MYGRTLKEVINSGVMWLVRTLLELLYSMWPAARVLYIKGPEKIQLCLSKTAVLQRGAD